MKKISGYVLAMILTASAVLTGCGGQSESESPKAEGGQGKTEATKGNGGGDESDEQITLTNYIKAFSQLD